MRRIVSLVTLALAPGALALTQSDTATATRPLSPGDPFLDLAPDLRLRFEAGKERFLHNYTPEEGLGPVYNETGCQVCHGGASGIPGGPDPLGLGSIHNVKHIGFDNQGFFDPMSDRGGSLLARQTIADDGYPRCQIARQTVPAIANILSIRNTPAVLGLGLIDALPDQEILGHQNLGIDGIHGVANWGIELDAVDDAPNPLVAQVRDLGPPRVGRFGWKAQTATLEQFSAEPLNAELGISGKFFPQEHTDRGLRLVAHLPNDCNVTLPKGCPPGTFSGAMPRTSECLATTPDDPDSSQALAIYNFQALLAPAPRGPVGVAAQWGSREFQRIGCAECHIPEARTGPEYRMRVPGGQYVRVSQLENKTLYPFSDFLLHDMGPDLADGGGKNVVGRVQGRARGNQWRTAPLWGIRLKASYLHDGRTTVITDAIAIHGGEAQIVRDRFAGLSEGAKAAIVEYLLTL